MEPCDRQLLEAYLDGELNAENCELVEQHLKECAACTQEVAEIKRVSGMLSGYAFEDITPDELAGIHQAVDDAADRFIWRLGGTLGLVAASILIVGLAWLQAMPVRTQSAPQTTASTPSWERVAMTLRAGPLPAGAANPEVRLAESDSPDAQLADYMLGITPAQGATP